MNPLGISPAFISLTSRFSSKDVHAIARRASLAATLILIIFTLIGDLIFSFYGITIHAFRIAGGILFFRSGLKMLESIQSRTRSTPKEQEEALTKNDLAVSPIGIPLIAGPGAITAAMILAGQIGDLKRVISFGVALASVMLLTYLVLRSAEFLRNRLGTTGTRVIQRLMGLLIVVIAVQYIINGVTPVMQNILQNAM